MTIAHWPPSTGDVQPTENGCFTGSSPVWPTIYEHSDMNWYLLTVCLPLNLQQRLCVSRASRRRVERHDQRSKVVVWLKKFTKTTA